MTLESFFFFLTETSNVRAFLTSVQILLKKQNSFHSSLHITSSFKNFKKKYLTPLILNCRTSSTYLNKEWILSVMLPYTHTAEPQHTYITNNTNIFQTNLSEFCVSTVIRCKVNISIIVVPSKL